MEGKVYVPFPPDSASVQDTPKLTLVIMYPESEWTGSGSIREQIAEWSRRRGNSPRLYPGSLVWCLKKSGRDLREKVEFWLAWKKVAKEVTEGTLGGDFDKGDRVEIQSKVAGSEEAAKDEVWGGYRYAVILDSKEPDGLKAIDLGAGHSSSGETLCGRVITALKSQALLNESVGAGYIDRNWPPALKESGAWPLASLRKSFLDGSLTRLLDPDAVLKMKIVEFVGKGDFGLGSGKRPDGTYERLWFSEPVSSDEVVFESGVFLLKKTKAKALKTILEPILEPGPEPTPEPGPAPEPGPQPELGPKPMSSARTIRISGEVPPEIWNRLGTKILPKLRTGKDLSVGIEISVSVDDALAKGLETDIRQILEDLGLSDKLRIE